MKHTLISIALLTVCLAAAATEPQLVVQQVTNNGLVDGNTYRLFAALDNDQTLHAVFGDEQNPLVISTTGSFYQHASGSYNAAVINSALYQWDATIAYDSWIALGYENSLNSDRWDIGIDFLDFNSGGTLEVNDGAWFLLPTDARCHADENGLLLLGQFTTTGVVSGTLNVQGRYADGTTWQSRALTFTSENAATDVANYTQGQTTSGQIQSEIAQGETHHHTTASAITASGSILVFPNPVVGENIQLALQNMSEGNTLLTIMDVTGKQVYREEFIHELNTHSVKSIPHSLSGGMYMLVVISGTQEFNVSFIVER